MNDNVVQKELSKKRIDFLDYLKAVCVLMVITTHYSWKTKETLIFYLVIKMAVPIFMIVSGYNFAMSYGKNTNGTLKEMYDFKLLLAKVKRFLVPFWVICMIELVIKIYKNEECSLRQFLIFGGYGPGSYYVPMMIQLLAIFPLIYWVIKHYDKVGVLIIALMNFSYEIFVAICSINANFYRLCIGRYLFMIALGCYIYVNKGKKVEWKMLVGMFLMGLSYIIFLFKQGEPLILFKYWKGTAMPIALYIFPIMMLLFKLFYECHIQGIPRTILSCIGKASYHIYLVQMVYYHFSFGGKIMEMHWSIAVPFNILVCVIFGIIFYYHPFLSFICPARVKSS